MRLFNFLEENDGSFFFSVVLAAKAAQNQSFLSQFAGKLTQLSSAGVWKSSKTTLKRVLVGASDGVLPQPDEPLLFLVYPRGGKAWRKLLESADALDLKKSYGIQLGEEKKLTGSVEVIGMHCMLNDDTTVITTRAKYILRKDGVFALLTLSSNPDGGDIILLPRYQSALRLAFGDGEKNL